MFSPVSNTNHQGGPVSSEAQEPDTHDAAGVAAVFPPHQAELTLALHAA